MRIIHRNYGNYDFGGAFLFYSSLSCYFFRNPACFLATTFSLLEFSFSFQSFSLDPTLNPRFITTPRDSSSLSTSDILSSCKYIFSSHITVFNRKITWIFNRAELSHLWYKPFSSLFSPRTRMTNIINDLYNRLSTSPWAYFSVEKLHLHSEFKYETAN